MVIGIIIVAVFGFFIARYIKAQNISETPSTYIGSRGSLNEWNPAVKKSVPVESIPNTVSEHVKELVEAQS